MGIPSDQSIRFPSVPLVCTKTFPVGCAPDNRNSSVFALAPPTLDIFFTYGRFYPNRVGYPDIYGFTTDSVEVRCR